MMERAAIDFDPEPAGGTRVVLVGFMGTGKTTLARRWASSGGPAFWFDSDREALQRLGADSITDAFDRLGENAFREVERAVIVERAAPLTRGLEVWSLGGGALMHGDVRAALEGACVVWLDAPAECLWKRVAGTDRPLARDYDRFLALYDQRRALYEELATVRIDASCEPDELGLGRVLAGYLPPSWFGSGLAVGDGVLGRVADLAALAGSEVVVVADRAVDHLADDMVDRLTRAGIVPLSDLRLPMGEWNKQLATVERLLVEWAGAGVHRATKVIAIGGGTTLDAVGFAASIYQRGIDWVSVPTTVTSQVDAGIGGKTGVNLGVAKNVVGAVHMPRAIVIDPTVIDTLPPDAIRDGFVEAAKTALLAGPWLLDLARGVAGASDTDRHAAWVELVGGCAAFKDAVVAEDPFDTDGIRAQLNLGHTLGHAVEAATGGAVSHGAAVAIGTCAALHLSELVADAPHHLVDTWHELCMQMGIVTRSPLAWEAIEPFLVHDKKRDAKGIGWVLLEDVGQPLTAARIPIEAVRRIWEQHVQLPVEAPALGAGGSANGAYLAHDVQPRVLVLFGANLGELGRRDPEHYGSATLPELIHRVEEWAMGLGLIADCRQTDSLERFLQALHEARLGHHAVIVNPGAWTHHELAIHDALEPLRCPKVEVHLSDVDSREEFRRTSVIRAAVDHVVSGRGADGYREALEWARAQVAAGTA